jgi:predicted HicB family RNase H-like nuclease
MKDLMHYKDYYGSVHFDEEEMIFHGKIEFIRALVSYEGTDARTLKKSFEEAVDDYLEICKIKSIEPEKSLKGSLNIRIGSELHRKVAIAAQQKHISINKLITETLSHVFVFGDEENVHAR